MAIQGQVVTLNDSRSEIAVREDTTSETRTYKVLNKEILENLKQGDHVRINSVDQKTAESVTKTNAI